MLRTLANWWRRGRVPVVDPAQLTLTFEAPTPSRSSLRSPRRRRAGEGAAGADAPGTSSAPAATLTTADADAPLVVRLRAMHADFNRRCFGGALTRVDIIVSRRMRKRLGHYQLARKDAPGLIALSRRHIRRHGWAGAQETLLHEMVHQWQDEQGHPVDHGAGFRRMARAVGITPRATRRV